MLIRKAFVLVLVSFCLTSILSAQDALKQGVYYLSGSVSFISSSNEMEDNFGREKTESINFSVQPSFNYFIVNNLSLGAGVTIWYSDIENTYANHSDSFIFRSYGVGPNIRYYFPGNTLVPLIGASASYRASGGEGQYQEGNDFTFFAGVNYFLSRGAAIEPFVSYSIGSMNKPEQDIKQFSIGVRMNYFIVN